MARPSNRAQRRAEIVDGLLTVVAERGYERASVAQIAAAAGLSAGLVHHHFGNKREVLVALVETLEANVEGRYVAVAEPREALLALIDVWLSRGPGSDPRAVAAWVAIGAEAVFLPEVREVFQAALGRLHGRSRTLAAGWLGEGRGGEADAVAALVVATIQGAFLVAAAAPELSPPGWAADTLKAAVTALVAERG